jgi:hypothetical protein
MGNTWITDLRYFRAENGLIAPEPANKFIEFLGSIVMMVTLDFSHLQKETPIVVRCRRRPQRKPCRGEIEGFIDTQTGEILWWCYLCSDNGNILNWQDTRWDCFDAGYLQ